MVEKIIFKSSVEKFSRRIWKLFFPYGFLFFPFLLIPLFTENDFNQILISQILVVVGTLFVFLTSYKWALHRISTIKIKSDSFEINIMRKDILITHNISRNKIKTLLNWKGNRPKMLVLSIFDGENKVVDLYSGGQKEDEICWRRLFFK